MKLEMRFAGSGGQGVILASVVVAEAAVVSGLEAVQSQSYGPEARGGMAKGEAILSREPIRFSKVLRPDFLLALTQEALEKFSSDLAPGALVMADESLSAPAWLEKERVLFLPILRTAKEKTGRLMTANIVAVGAINAALGLFGKEALEEGVRRHIPAGTEELNWRALAAGAGLVDNAAARRFSPRFSL